MTTAPKKYLLLLIAAVLFCCKITSAQNLSTPNKPGPLGTQVNTASGNLFIPRNDITVPARGFDINVNFFYNAFNYDQNNGFGNGWTFSYNIRYGIDTAGACTITWGDGREDVYAAIPGGGFKSPQGFFNTLTQYQSNKYLLTQLNGTKVYFDNSTHRKITRTEEPNGNYINFTYSDSLLTSLVNNSGQSISFTYDATGKLTAVTDAIAASTRVFSYSYDGAGNLTQVMDPMGGKNKYSYLVNGPMKSITDKNNNTADIIYFPDYTVSEIIGCNRRISFSYDTTAHVNVAIDHLASGENQVTDYTFKPDGNFIRLIKKSGNCCGYNMDFTYDAAGNIIKQTDANGNNTMFTYDNKGNRLTTTDALGHVSTFTYTTDYYSLKTYTDPKGYMYTFNYDTRGNLTQIIGPGTMLNSLSYSALGDITSVTDANGNVTNFSYDSYGNNTQITAPLGLAVHVSADARHNILSTTDPRGFTSSSQYDLLNRVVVMTDAYNHTVNITYDAEDNINSIKNENGEVNSFAYDASGRLIKSINALGYQTSYSYDAMENLTGMKDAAGGNYSMEYDHLNRLIRYTDPMGNADNFSYDNNGNVTNAQYSNGMNVTNTYDALDRLLTSRDALGPVNGYAYDANGNVISVINGTGAATNYSYDALNRVMKVTDPLGNDGLIAYDNNSNMISATDRNHGTSHYTYDALNRIISSQDRNGFTTHAAYDLAGNLLSLTDHNNRSTTYAYDNLSRLVSTTYPDGRYAQLAYDNVGNPVSRRLTDGNTILYAYDSLNRLKIKTLPGNNAFAYTYDAMNRLLTAVNSSAAVSISYDPLNRVTSESLNGKITAYTYNTANNLQTTYYPDSMAITKTFDTRGRLLSLAKNTVNVASFMYNNENQVTAKSYANSVHTDIQYDFANRISSMIAGNGMLQNATYSFDASGNKNAITKSNLPGSSEQFTYDADNRLVDYRRGPVGAPISQHTYTYDALGNKLSDNANGVITTYSSNNLNQLTTAATGSANVNYIYDNNGNLIFDGTFFKTFDEEGRLLKDSASPANIITYNYDALGRRIRKIVNGGSAVNYIYSQSSQIEQRDAATDSLISRTAFNGFVNPVFTEHNNHTYYYQTNDLNSVEALTDEGGSLAERYDYDPYGKTTIYNAAGNIITNSAVENHFNFTGQEYDRETQNYHFPLRDYSAITGTFRQRDHIGYNDGMNMYRYVRNNVSNDVDLYGSQGRNMGDEPSPTSAGSGPYGYTPYNPRSPEALSRQPSMPFDIPGFIYGSAKTNKDANSIISGLTDLIEKAREYNPNQFKINEKALSFFDVLRKNEGYQKFSALFNSLRYQKYLTFLKGFFLLDKIGKLVYTTVCVKGQWVKKGILGAEVGLSGWSLYYSILKVTRSERIISIGAKRLLGIFSLLDATSGLTTGKSVITNVIDLPKNANIILEGIVEDYIEHGGDRLLGDREYIKVMP